VTSPPPLKRKRAEWVLSAPGSHTERVDLLAALARDAAPLYARPQDLPALRRAVERPWGEGGREGGEGRLEDLLATLESRSEVISAPWTHAARLLELPALLPVGEFTLCADDSRIGSPRTLLLHWGAEPLYRVAPPALTLPREGALRCARFEQVEDEEGGAGVRGAGERGGLSVRRGELITLRVTLCDAHLTPKAPPWVLTARSGSLA
jgi:hypothetical protein